jgi:hypothetical protein
MYRRMNSFHVPKRIPISSTRTEDPGVLELLTYVLPSNSQSRWLQGPTKLQFSRVKDPMIQGESSLQMYKEVLTRKRRRAEFERANTNKKLISFRVGSTSSRSTIFDPSEVNKVPLFLQATYPRQVQDGVKRFDEEAYNEGINLGSYNCRPLPPKDSVIINSTSKNRFVVGRTRLLWSQREQAQAKSQRSPYCSILTGLRLETNSLKRPLSIKVGIRINGVLISSSRSQGAQMLAHNSTTFELSYSNKSVQDALDEACRAVPPLAECVQNDTILSQDCSQCSINVSEFVAEIARNSKACEQQRQQSISKVDQIRMPMSINRQLLMFQSSTSESNTYDHIYRICYKDELIGTVSEFSTEQEEVFHDGKSYFLESMLKLNLHVVPPRIDCLPTVDGLIHVTCTTPGKITYLTEAVPDKEPTNATGKMCATSGKVSSISLLLIALAAETNRCAACWNYKEANKICIRCDYSHGIVFPNDDGNKWIHNIGKPWCDIDTATPGELYSDHANGNIDNDWYCDKSCCHLCSNGSMGSVAVVSCPVEGCNVRFHPICAIIVSAANEMQYKNKRDDVELNGDCSSLTQKKIFLDDDTYLCTQYIQSSIQTSFVRATNNMIHNKDKKPSTSPAISRSAPNRRVRTTKQNGKSKKKTSTPKATLSNTPTTRSRRATNASTSNQSIVLPIVFCPYHNPKRSREYYGLYPNGCYFNHDIIRVPPQRK